MKRERVAIHKGDQALLDKELRCTVGQNRTGNGGYPKRLL